MRVLVSALSLLLVALPASAQSILPTDSSDRSTQVLCCGNGSALEDGTVASFGLGPATLLSGVSLADIAIGLTQEGLGRIGPGDLDLSTRDEELTPESSSEIGARTAEPFAFAFMAMGIGKRPTQMLGGMFVCIPSPESGIDVADGEDRLNFRVIGGVNSATAYPQVLLLDSTQPRGVDVSNAVELQLL